MGGRVQIHLLDVGWLLEGLGEDAERVVHAITRRFGTTMVLLLGADAGGFLVNWHYSTNFLELTMIISLERLISVESLLIIIVSFIILFVKLLVNIGGSMTTCWTVKSSGIWRVIAKFVGSGSLAEYLLLAQANIPLSRIRSEVSQGLETHPLQMRLVNLLLLPVQGLEAPFRRGIWIRFYGLGLARFERLNWLI